MPDDTITTLKSSIAQAVPDTEIKQDNLKLVLPSSPSAFLEDDKELSHYDIKNDSEVHMVYQISENQWETVSVSSAQAAAAPVST